MPETYLKDTPVLEDLTKPTVATQLLTLQGPAPSRHIEWRVTLSKPVVSFDVSEILVISDSGEPVTANLTVKNVLEEYLDYVVQVNVDFDDKYTLYFAEGLFLDESGNPSRQSWAASASVDATPPTTNIELNSYHNTNDSKVKWDNVASETIIPKKLGLQASLIALFNFDGSDKLANNVGLNKATLQGSGHTWVSGIGDSRAVHLNGAGSVDLGNDYSWLSPTLSISLWIKFDNTSNEQVIISSIPGHFIELGKSVNNTWFIDATETNSSIIANRWYHIVFSRPASQQGQLWIDGDFLTLVATLDYEIPSDLIALPHVNLGSSQGTDSFVIGTLDDVRLWHRDLSTRDIEDLYYSSSSLGEDGNFTLILESGVLFDWAGNGFKSSSTGQVVVIDMTRPSVVVGLTTAAPNIPVVLRGVSAYTVDWTVTFSEEVVGFGVDKVAFTAFPGISQNLSIVQSMGNKFYLIRLVVTQTGFYRIRVLEGVVSGITSQPVTASNVNQVAVVEWDASLATIALSPSLSLSPSFSNTEYNYSAVAKGVAFVTFTATTSDSTATMTINSTSLYQGVASTHFVLSTGINLFVITVTAADRNNSRSYTFSLQRELTQSATERVMLISACNRGSIFTQVSGWCSDADVCLWTGVSCDLNGAVESIVLSNRGLNGTIPSELGALKQLQTLFLNNNTLIGTVPRELGDASLVDLRIDQNYLSGELPDTIATLYTLETINCSRTWIISSLCSPTRGSTYIDMTTVIDIELSNNVPEFLNSSAVVLVASRIADPSGVNSTISTRLVENSLLNFHYYRVAIAVSANVLQINGILSRFSIAFSNNMAQFASLINGMGVSTESVSLHQGLNQTVVVDLSHPLSATFTDSNPVFGNISGTLSFQRAAVESEFFEYVLGLGHADGVINYLLAVLPVTTLTPYVVISNLQISSFTHFVIYSRMSSLSSKPLLLAILDTAAPEIKKQPEGGEVAEGTSFIATIIVQAGAVANDLIYQWKKFDSATSKFVALANQTSNSLQLHNISISNAGTYMVSTVMITNSSMKVDSVPINVTVDLKPSIVSQPSDTSIFIAVGTNQTIPLSATSRNGNHLRYQWYLNGNTLLNQKVSTLSLLPFTLADVGSYYCIIRDGQATAMSQIYIISADLCHNNNCLNGGVCINTGLSFHCSCINRYSGSDCSVAPQLSTGCADGSREGLNDGVVFPDIAVCAGNFTDFIGGPTAGALCNFGFHVCSASSSVDTIYLSQVSFSSATSFTGCFAYNAAHNGDRCRACEPTRSNDAMAGVGSDCPIVTKRANSCLANGRIDGVSEPGDFLSGTACCYKPWITGVVCCRNSEADSLSKGSALALIALNEWVEVDDDDIDEPSLPPIFFANTNFVTLQGAMQGTVTGLEYPIGRLPTGFEPKYSRVFVTTTAPTDTDEPFTVLDIHVLNNGYIVVSYPPPIVKQTISLDGFMFPTAQQESLFAQLTLSSGFANNVDTTYSRASYHVDGDGILHLAGVVILTSDCPEWCTMFTLPLLAGLQYQPTRTFLVSGTTQAQVEVFATGRVALSKGLKGDIAFLDKGTLVPSPMSTVLASDSPAVLSPWRTGEHSVYALKSSSNTIYLTGRVLYDTVDPSILPQTNPILVLGKNFRPTYPTKQAVGCAVSESRQSCVISIYPNGRMFVDVDATYGESSTGFWVSLDGIVFGGYTLTTEVTISGNATVEFSRAAYISL
jgi:hypothetical protein